jgi:hypothetical protein
MKISAKLPTEWPGMNVIMGHPLPKSPARLVVEIEPIKDNLPQFMAAGDLSAMYKAGSTRVTKFELTWDGVPVKIAPALWEDLRGFHLQKLKEPCPVFDQAATEAQRAILSAKQQRWMDRAKSLEHPRLWPCSEPGDTLLIEWTRWPGF